MNFKPPVSTKRYICESDTESRRGIEAEIVITHPIPVAMDGGRDEYAPHCESLCPFRERISELVCFGSSLMR